ncbi:HNH endonuclease [Enterococcus phage Toszka]
MNCWKAKGEILCQSAANFYNNLIGEFIIVQMTYKGELTPYFITKDGEVFNKQGRGMKCHLRGSGYNYIMLSIKGKKKFVRLCRLVAENFIPNPLGLPVVNHINAIRTDDRACNLEWVSYSYNNQDRYTRHPNPNKKKVMLFIEGEEIVLDSITEAAQMAKVSLTKMSEVVNGKSNSQNFSATFL